MNAQPLVNINRFEALVTETQDEDMNGPATFGVVRLLAAHIDSAFSQIQSSLIRLDDKIDSKVDSLEQKITARIDGLEIMLRADMTANHGIIMDQFAQRVNSDRFIKVGFAVAVIGVLLQTAIQIR